MVSNHRPLAVPRNRSGDQRRAGERRWRAARLAGQPTILALVDTSVEGAGPHELALIENVVREDLSPIEEATTIAVLLHDLNVTATVLAKRRGRSRTDLAHTVRLLDLPDQVIDLIDSGALTEGHRKALLIEPDHHRRRVLATRAAQEGWSIHALEPEIAPGPNPRPKPPTPHPDHEAAAARLEEAPRRRPAATPEPARIASAAWSPSIKPPANG